MTTDVKDTTTPPPAAGPRARGWRYLLGILGPGLITGAADDDPSGIATYSQTGAQFGYGQLWTAAWMLPLVTGVQEACGGNDGRPEVRYARPMARPHCRPSVGGETPGSLGRRKT